MILEEFECFGRALTLLNKEVNVAGVIAFAALIVVSLFIAVIAFTLFRAFLLFLFR